MSWTIFFLVLLAAFTHALWNGLVKRGGSPIFNMVALTLSMGVISLCLLPFIKIPQDEDLYWLAGSIAFHCTYSLMLINAYRHGALSRVYPISRGTAPMLLAIMGAVVLNDPLNPLHYGGILAISLGVLTMAWRGCYATLNIAP